MSLRSLTVLALLVVGAEALSFGALPLRAWGGGAYRFLPWPWFVAAILVLALSLVAARPRVTTALPSAGGGRLGNALSNPAAGLVLAVLAMALFWTFRVRHLLLGDGLPLTSSILAGEWFHPLEPLAMLLQARFYDLVTTLAAAPEPRTYVTAWNALAMGSVVAGGAFVLFAWYLSREIVRAGPGSETEPSGPWVATCWAVLFFQGYVLLFFGYVETYAWLAAGVALYLLIAFRCLRGSASVAAAGVACVFCVFLHLSAVTLLPSFLVLAALGLADPLRRRGAIIGLGTTLLAAFAGAWWMSAMNPGYSIAHTLAGTAGGVLREAAGPGGSVASREHGWAVLNELLLIGPAGAWWFAAFVIAAAAAWRRLQPRDAFLVALGGAALIACMLAGESNLGYPRNWDLLATQGLVIATAGVAGLLPRLDARRVLPTLAVTIAISLVHTGAWVAINACEDRSLRWFAALPLPRGQAESTLGYWQALRGRPDDAERLLRRSIEVDPQNVRAWMFLGRLHEEQRRYTEAAAAFERAARLRPDLAEARLGLARARLAADSLERAR